MQKKIGIMGGSFDPPHLGHLILAQEAEEFLQLDTVIFMPAAVSPLKGRAPTAPAEARLALVRAAIQGRPRWEVSDWEIRQGGTSYSFHTAAHLHELHPEAELFWILGADQLGQLSAWHRVEELCRLVRFVVALRVGSPLVKLVGLGAEVSVEELPTRCIDISSTEIRTRLQQGRPVDLFLPGRVWQHIEQENLYR